MQDADLFLELAGIAGVFVGFGALIAVRGSGPSEPLEVAPMRTVVTLGMMAVIAALAPVTLSRFGLAGHEIWAPSSAVVLACWLGLLVINLRTSEYREGWATMATARAHGVRAGEIVEDATFAFYILVSMVTPIVIMLGVAQDLEAALYFMVVVLILLGAAWALLWLVYMERRPAKA